ncbi:hypothetical protein [Thermomonas alba]|uniref:hypothetical protein n=1 Tax=Thermomonas alba TaxID=2888525 RepID=UPI001F041189|nr:hypothetical protein [Thermomonas alba]
MHRRLPHALLLAGTVLAGCHKARDASPLASAPEYTPAHAAAQADAGGRVTLPPGFPTDIYLPARHRVATAVDMAGMQMVNLMTPTATATVYAEADQGMQARGWKRELAMQSDDGSTLSFRKDGRQVFYQLVRDPSGGTQLAVRVASSD